MKLLLVIQIRILVIDSWLQQAAALNTIILRAMGTHLDWYKPYTLMSQIFAGTNCRGHLFSRDLIFAVLCENREIREIIKNREQTAKSVKI